MIARIANPLQHTRRLALFAAALLVLGLGYLYLARSTAASGAITRAGITEVFRPVRALGLYRITAPPGTTKLRLVATETGATVDLFVKFSALPLVARLDARGSGTAKVKLIAITAPQADTYYLALYGDYGQYAGISIAASYPVPTNTFKAGIHAHRLYNGGDWSGPASPEPLFRYGVIRDWDISKLHDAEIWNRDGSINFALIDQVYNGHAKRGAKVLKTFGLVPSWAAKRPDEPNRFYPSLPGGLSGPRDLDQYEDFIYRFVLHAKDFLWAVEGWNEPFACKENEKEFTTMNSTELADAQKRLYLASKRAAPQILVFSPPQGHQCGIPIILRARTSQGELMSDYFDVLAWHAYNRSANGVAGNNYAQAVAQVRAYLADAGLPKLPIADTEHGWGPWDPSGPRFTALSDDQKGKILYDTAKLSKSLGVLMIGWYSYDDEMIGMPMNNPVLSSWLQKIYDDLDTR